MTANFDAAPGALDLPDESVRMWEHERPAGYNQLAWVQATSITQPFIELARPGGIHVDMGTGTGAILKTLADYQATSIGVDASREMLNRVGPAREGNTQYLIQADAISGLPLGNATADLVTERMMLHDLDDPVAAVREGWRILKPGGALIASEYVVDRPSEDAILRLAKFETAVPGEHVSPLMPSSAYSDAPERVTGLLRELFTFKHEPDRFLWQSSEFAAVVAEACPEASVEVQLSLEDHSVANWLEKSGFPIEECKQLGIMACLGADPDVKQGLGLRFTRNGLNLSEDFHKAVLHAYEHASSAERENMGLDARFPAAFAFVKATKPQG